MNPLAFIITSMLGRTRAAPEPAPTPVDPEPAPYHGKTSTPWTLTLTDATGEGRTWVDPEPQITLLGMPQRPQRPPRTVEPLRPADPERNPGARERNAAKWARRAASRRQGA